MSVEFDPVKLDRRRRRVEPAVIGAVVVALAIGVAVAKPWEPSSTSPQPDASQVAVTTTDASASPILTPSEAPRGTQAGPDWTAVTNAVTEHDAWGVTAVLRHGPGAAGTTSTTSLIYDELWTPTSTDWTGGDSAVITRAGADVSALAITVPNAVQVRAVRLWRLHQSNDLEWIDAAAIDNQAGARAPLLVRMPLVEGTDPTPWEAGQYRADVLTGDGIRRIAVVIAKQFGDAPGPDDWPTAAPDTVAATSSDPSAIRVGMFATVDGGAVSIPARESNPLDEVDAWRDSAVGGDSTVASIYLPRATGLGVMLTSHAAVDAASIERLAPDPLADAPASSGGISDAQGRTPFVVFAAPGGGAWTPGVYAVTVDWKDAAGAHHGTWHVELRPGVG